MVGLLTLMVVLAAAPARGQVLDNRPDAGAPGSTLQLYGPGLTTSLDVVTIGGEEAQILDAPSPDRIRVEVPTTDGGPAPVELQRSSGGPLVGAELFTVVTGGPATFTPGVDLFSDTNDESSPHTLDVGDIDGDGTLDVVAGFLQNGTVAWFPGDGSGDQNTVTSGFNYPRAVLLADVVDDQDGNGPGDGDLDIVAVAGANNASSDGDDKIRVFPNQGNGSFGGQDIVGSTYVDDVRDIAAGDLDGDGDIDLVSVSQDNGRVVVHENENNSSSFVHSTISQLNDPRAVEVSDVDGDGRLDLLVADHGTGGSVLLFPNGGGSSFESGQAVLSDIANATDLAIADFNRDGAPGLAVAASGTGDVRILPNEVGTLTGPAIVLSGLGATQAVHAADLTGDGRPDVLATDESSQDAVWFRNDGGSYQRQEPLSTLTASTTAIQAADLDADGDLDPVYTSKGPDAITLFPNDTGAPSISGFPDDQTIDEDGSTGPLTFTVSDPEDSSLATTPSSNNQDLVPDSNISITGPDNDGNTTIEVVPLPDSNSAVPTGTATISVAVEDEDGNVQTGSFELTVNPVNDAPTVGAVSNQTINEDGSTGPVPVTISDIDTDIASLTLSASSDNPAVLPDGNLAVEGTGTDRTVTATPLPDSSGTATVTLSVSDGDLSATTSFTIDVIPVDDPPKVSAAQATGVTSTAATLTALVTPLDAATDVSFIIEPSDGSGAEQTLTGGSSLIGSDPLSVQANATGLQPDTEYRVEVEATSLIGTTTREFLFSTINPLSLSPAGLAFAPLGADSRRSREIVATNNRVTAADITRVEIAGPDAGMFSIVSGPAVPFTLSAGADTTFRISYAPTTAGGTQSASLAVETGIGIETAALQGSAQPRYRVPIGRIPVDETVTTPVGYNNPLPEPVTVTDVEITGPDADVFSLGSDVVDRQFESGETATLPIRVRSAEPGSLSGTLTITTTAGQFVADLVARAIALDARVADGPIPMVGTSVPVRVDIPAALSPSEAKLYYRPTGSASFEARSFPATSGESTTVSIPGSAVTPAGTEFYVEIIDRQDETPLRLTSPAAAPDRNLKTVAPQIGRISSRGSVRPRQYRMYSIPVRPDTTLEAILTAPYNFGRYDRSEWRAFRHTPGLGAIRDGRPPERIRPQEFPEIDDLGEPGTAFWHVTQSDRRLRIRGAKAVDPSEPARIQLAPGWNQIGSPFPFAIDWQAVVDTTRSQLADSTARAALGRVSAPVAWTGRRYRFDVQTLRPWHGYFVFNPNADQPIELQVPPVRSSTGGATTDTQGKTLEPGPAPSSSESASSNRFQLQLQARVRVDGLDRALTDAANWIGVMPDARDGIGPEDRPEPPPIGNYVRLSILESGGAGAYRATSFRSPSPEGHTWQIEVAAQVRERFFTDKNVTVALENDNHLPDGFRVYVLDMEEQRLLPRENGSVSVPLTADRPIRSLRVIVGTEAYAEQNSDGVPLESFDYALKGNYPNPLDAQTRIAYTLKKESPVTLTIYDLLGRRIRTLVDGSMQKTGPQEVVWDGRNAFGAPVASGVYVYRLEAGSFTATGKMTVVR